MLTMRTPVIDRFFHKALRRGFRNSGSRQFTDIPVLRDAVVHCRGDLPYGSREYVLLPPHVTLYDLEASTSSPNEQNGPGNLKLASLFAHRNIVFGANVVNAENSRHRLTIREACPVLLETALNDASADGEQPQAVSTLYGLCAWVVDGLEGRVVSRALEKLREDDTSFHAVQAMATGVPRPGHSVVGQGTYRDGQAGWEELAKEFVQTAPSDECLLYLNHQAQLVGIEHMASTKVDYLQSAGGAMARFFFV
jgi:hypothetical protein